MDRGLGLVGQNVRLDNGRGYADYIGPEEETRLEPIKHIHGGLADYLENRKVGFDDARRQEAAPIYAESSRLSAHLCPILGQSALHSPVFRHGGEDHEKDFIHSP
jgi:hypothetical protein